MDWLLPSFEHGVLALRQSGDGRKHHWIEAPPPSYNETKSIDGSVGWMFASTTSGHTQQEMEAVALIQRRAFLLGAGAVMTAYAGRAAANTLPRIVILSLAAPKQQMLAFEEGLKSRGLIQGSTIDLVHKSANGQREALRRIAAEAVSLAPKVIVAVGTVAATVAQEATSDIPIVAVTGDMASAGLVKNFGRPEGNLTGFSFFTTELTIKRLELLLQINPSLRQLKIIMPAKRHRTETKTLSTLRGYLEKYKINAEILGLTSADEVEAKIASVSSTPDESLLVLPSVMIDGQAREIGGLLAKHHVVALLPWKEYVEGGGLMSYSPDIIAIWRNASSYVARILQGANPRELPVMLPTKFELVINLRSAQALGLTVPATLLLRADHVIE